MAGLLVSTSSDFLVQKKLIDSKLLSVNTIMFGTIVSINGSKSTINLINKITTQDQFGNLNSTDYSPITTNFVTLSLYQYVPSPGDTVCLLVSQSNIQPLLTGNQTVTLSKFNIYDSVMLPVSLGYNDQTTVVAGILSKVFNVNCSKFSVNNGTNELISALIEALTALQNLTVGGTPIDNTAPIAAAIAKINTFLV